MVLLFTNYIFIRPMFRSTACKFLEIIQMNSLQSMNAKQYTCKIFISVYAEGRQEPDAAHYQVCCVALVLMAYCETSDFLRVNLFPSLQFC